jgi:hypothetical protein
MNIYGLYHGFCIAVQTYCVGSSILRVGNGPFKMSRHEIGSR